MVDLQTVIDEINTGKIEFDYKDDDCCTTEGEVVILLKRLAELETADVVEVVRCRNCKHRRETMNGSYCLPAFGLKRITDLDAFCSYGERRDT